MEADTLLLRACRLGADKGFGGPPCGCRLGRGSALRFFASATRGRGLLAQVQCPIAKHVEERRPVAERGPDLLFRLRLPASGPGAATSKTASGYMALDYDDRTLTNLRAMKLVEQVLRCFALLGCAEVRCGAL